MKSSSSYHFEQRISSAENFTMNPDPLVRVDDVVSEEFRDLFQFETFNKMQSALISTTLESNSNLVIASPTGSGKTVIHELAIIQRHTGKSRLGKCVYIAPNKALCQQRAVEWSRKFGSHGLRVIEMTGDVEAKQCMELVDDADIVVTTPEKWDALTRSWKRNILGLGVDLLLLDEIHHVGEDRGSTLEMVVIRTQSISDAYFESSSVKELHGTFPAARLRIVALSATLPNIVDIGTWLQCSTDCIHYFDEGFRPVPLTVHVVSYSSSSNKYLFEKGLDERVPEVIRKYSDKSQSLIFCSSKNGTELLASLLLTRMGSQYGGQQNSSLDVTGGLKTEPGSESQSSSTELHSMVDQNLKLLIASGYAYHHGGLPADDRAVVEELFLSGRIKILCSTSTLAHGVNLPAHLVVIKGTNTWRGGGRGYERISRSEMIQMIGRAGRPGFDTSGVAVIMTSNEDRGFYDRISLTADVVESTLPAKLTEVILCIALCVEVSQSGFNTIADCVEWLKRTFYYVRVQRNPMHYGIELTSSVHLDDILEAQCMRCIEQLSAAKIISIASRGGQIFVNPEVEAHIMTRHIVSFPTMVTLMALDRMSNIAMLLQELSHCAELGKPVKRADKNLLNEAMKHVRFPLKLKVQEPWHKVYVLTQAAVNRWPLNDFASRIEQTEIVERSLLLLAALKDICIERKHGTLLESCVLVMRSLQMRLWEEDYDSVFSQCCVLSTATRQKLHRCGFTRLEDIRCFYDSNKDSSAEAAKGPSYTLSPVPAASAVEKLVTTLSCSVIEARALILFTRAASQTLMGLSIEFDSSSSCVVIAVHPVDQHSLSSRSILTCHGRRDDHRGDDMSGEVDSGEVGSGLQHSNALSYDNLLQAGIPMGQSPSYVLICTHFLSGELLYFQKISDCISVHTMRMGLPEFASFSSIKITLLSTLVGLDHIHWPTDLGEPKPSAATLSKRSTAKAASPRPARQKSKSTPALKHELFESGSLALNARDQPAQRIRTGSSVNAGVQSPAHVGIGFGHFNYDSSASTRGTMPLGSQMDLESSAKLAPPQVRSDAYPTSNEYEHSALVSSNVSQSFSGNGKGKGKDDHGKCVNKMIVTPNVSSPTHMIQQTLEQAMQRGRSNSSGAVVSAPVQRQNKNRPIEDLSWVNAASSYKMPRTASLIPESPIPHAHFDSSMHFTHSGNSVTSFEQKNAHNFSQSAAKVCVDSRRLPESTQPVVGYSTWPCEDQGYTQVQQSYNRKSESDQPYRDFDRTEVTGSKATCCSVEKGSELDILRCKARELELYQLPVKRLKPLPPRPTDFVPIQSQLHPHQLLPLTQRHLPAYLAPEITSQNRLQEMHEFPHPVNNFRLAATGRERLAEETPRNFSHHFNVDDSILIQPNRPHCPSQSDPRPIDSSRDLDNGNSSRSSRNWNSKPDGTLSHEAKSSFFSQHSALPEVLPVDAANMWRKVAHRDSSTHTAPHIRGDLQDQHNATRVASVASPFRPPGVRNDAGHLTNLSSDVHHENENIQPEPSSINRTYPTQLGGSLQAPAFAASTLPPTRIDQTFSDYPKSISGYSSLRKSPGWTWGSGKGLVALTQGRLINASGSKAKIRHPEPPQDNFDDTFF